MVQGVDVFPFSPDHERGDQGSLDSPVECGRGSKAIAPGVVEDNKDAGDHQRVWMNPDIGWLVVM